MRNAVIVKVAEIKQELINHLVKEETVNMTLLKQINNMSTDEIVLILLRNIDLSDTSEAIFMDINTQFKEADDLPF